METISLITDLVTIALLVAALVILYLSTREKKEEAKPISIFIDISNSGVKTFYEETKIVNTTAELVTEFTRCMETITQDKKKIATIEVSNSANGGYVMKTKFGSS